MQSAQHLRSKQASTPPALRSRRGALSGGLVALALAASLAPARADDWTDCDSTGAARVEPACTAVIEKAERSPQDLASAYARRGEFCRLPGMPCKALRHFPPVL